MIRLIITVFLSILFVAPEASWAKTSQYPDPNRQTIWNNLTDTMHTVGQDPQQAKRTKLKLHSIRNTTRSRDVQLAAQAKRKARMKVWQDSQNN